MSRGLHEQRGRLYSFPMSFRPPLRRSGALFAVSLLLLCGSAHADDWITQEVAKQKKATPLLERAGSSANETVEQALGLIGIRYRRGGNSPETGFDCSGFVSHVFRSLGTILPRTSREISKNGEAVRKDDLQPGDLVFFNTMRRTFSHVGIYLGDNRFVHAPASGGEVRVDDMREKYWGKRFNGARRIYAE